MVVQAISGMDLSGGAFSSFAPWQLAFLAAATPGIAVVLLMLTVREPPRQELSGAVADARVTLPLREVFTFMGANRRLLVARRPLISCAVNMEAVGLLGIEAG